MTSENYTVCSETTQDQYRRRYVTAKTNIKKGDVIIRELPLIAHSRYGFSKQPIWISDEVVTAKPPCSKKGGVFQIILEGLMEKKSPLLTSFEWLQEFSDGSENSDWDFYRIQDAYKIVDTILSSKTGRDFGLTDETHRAHLKRLARVWCVNHFECVTKFSHVEYGHALYKTSSFFNHSCAPNCYWTMSEKQSIVIFANADIDVGSEITISYRGHGNADSLMPNLRLGFACVCKLCATKQSAAAFVVNKKLELLRNAQQVLEFGNSQSVEIFSRCEKNLQAQDVKKFAKQHPKEFVNFYCPVILKAATIHAASEIQSSRLLDFFSGLATLLKEVTDAIEPKKTYTWYLAASYMLLSEMYPFCITTGRHKAQQTQAIFAGLSLFCAKTIGQLSEYLVEGNLFPNLKESRLEIAKERAFANLAED